MNNKTVLYINDIVQETADAITIYFAQPQSQLNYLSGQFAGLELEIDIPYSCQRGSFISCVGKYLAGKVEMLTTEGLRQHSVVTTLFGQASGQQIEFLP
ncbi:MULTISPECIES: hypothetical protein [Sphingobacterium]|uniref:hypothetical protein n=1 Tax=Sphingobacterium TaxID=28453 RepID=UPI0013DA2A1B|nr:MULTISPECIES: hypothetical protein [unclassified Sphingobacterium]